MISKSSSLIPVVCACLLPAGVAPGNTLCLGPSSGSGLQLTVDCEQVPSEWSHRWLGFSDDPSDVCMDCLCLPGLCPYNDKGTLCSGDAVWSISASPTDALETVAAIPPDGWLHLWFAANRFPVDGFTAAEFRLTGSLAPTEFEPLNGVQVIPDTFPDLLLHVSECTSGPFLVGRIRVNDATSVDLRSWGRSKALYR